MTASKNKSRSSRWSHWGRSLIVTLGTGTMFATSCSPETMRAVIVAIDAATRTFTDAQDDQNDNFGDWLLDELID